VGTRSDTSWITRSSRSQTTLPNRSRTTRGESPRSLDPPGLGVVRESEALSFSPVSSGDTGVARPLARSPVSPCHRREAPVSSGTAGPARLPSSGRDRDSGEQSSPTSRSLRSRDRRPLSVPPEFATYRVVTGRHPACRLAVWNPAVAVLPTPPRLLSDRTASRPLAVARVLLGFGRHQLASCRTPGCRRNDRMTGGACDFTEIPARATPTCAREGTGRCREVPEAGEVEVRCCRGCGRCADAVAVAVEYSVCTGSSSGAVAVADPVFGAVAVRGSCRGHIAPTSPTPTT
jgi:hypothetical protein